MLRRGEVIRFDDSDPDLAGFATWTGETGAARMICIGHVVGR